jgi:hypothetical protein
MQLLGSWRRFDDGITRPVISVAVVGREGRRCREDFLVDCGSDRTVLNAAMYDRLDLPSTLPTDETSLVGVSGHVSFVLVETALELPRNDGGVARIRGAFAAITDPAAVDLCILGRDVLNHFHLVLSFTQNEVLLLSGNHRYRIEQTFKR